VLLLVRQSIVSRHTDKLLEDMRSSAEDRIAVSETDAEENTPLESEADNEADNEADKDKEQNTDASEVTPAVDNPYRDSFLANEDMAAWLKIEDTVIDYPVMWTPREETYYLYRNFEGADDKNGCLILDTDSSLNPLTTNLIIHGHNMRSGAMFGNLTDYEDPDYCKAHSRITLYTEECERQYEVLAVFRSQVYRKTDQVFKYYKFFQADTQEEFDEFYQNIKALSLYDTGVTAEFGDHFITLSTCVYHVEQGRFVVVAKEVETGDVYAPFREQENTN
jgi:sortase B